MSEHLCILQCGRHYERAHVCEPDRRRLAQRLHDITRLHARLSEALQNAPGAATRVSGTRTPPVPLNLDSVDLSGPARHAAMRVHTRAMLDGDDDAVGHLSVATTLDAMARDWRDVLCPDEHLPVPSVPTLAQWLANRLDDACDRHPAIDEDATLLEELRATLRSLLGDFPAKPELCEGVACKGCDMRALYRGEKWITCGNCGLLYSAEEYREWTGLLAASVRTMTP